MKDESKTFGRPSKYNKEIQLAADYYASEGFLEVGEVVPSAAGLACYLKISRSTIYEWKDCFQDFSDTLGKIDVKQETITLNGALKGALNATISKLLLANHGYSDRQELAHTSPDGSMSPAASQEAVLAALARKHQD